MAQTREMPSWLDEITIEQLENDPYPIFARLRREAPIAWIPVLGSWFASNWQYCRQIASDSEHFVGGTDPALDYVFGQPCVLSIDGEVHDDLRAMIDPHLRPRAVNRYIEQLARPIARHYLAEIRDRGRADLMAEYFEPISVRALGDVLGLQQVDSETLRHWFHDLSSGIVNKAVDAEGNFLNPAGFAASLAARAEIEAVVNPMLDRFEKEPNDSGLSHWLHDGMPEGQVRSREYIFPNLLVVLLGGMQEPGHACGATMLGLFTQPDQLRRVVENRNLISKAVAEGLRWLSPITTTTGRRPKQDFELGGVTLPAGQNVLLSYGSANRDAAEFEQPEIFNMDRPPRPHLAFGTGVHICAGAAFAPQVARIALEELLGAIPSIEFDPDHEVVVWGWFFRGPRVLHARWTT
jgi:cytochrome P450